MAVLSSRTARSSASILSFLSARSCLPVLSHHPAHPLIIPQKPLMHNLDFTPFHWTTHL
jgi:hypothetical protein